MIYTSSSQLVVLTFKYKKQKVQIMSVLTEINRVIHQFLIFLLKELFLKIYKHTCKSVHFAF